MPPLEQPTAQPDPVFNGYTIPFLVFLSLTGLTNLIPGGTYVVYPLKTFLGAGLLWYYRKEYLELKDWRFHWSAVVVGLLVTVLWVGLDAYYPKLSPSPGFNPFTTGNPTTDLLMAAVRLGGSFLVVPVLEELFWRSWLLRFLVDQADYRRVPLGHFTWFSFLVACILFGLEHDRWLAGILTGALYSSLVYWHKEIRSPIVAHGVTNLSLGIYIFMTGNWSLW